MNKRIPFLLALWAGILLFSTCYAQTQPHVFRGATLIPIAGAPITNGVLVVQNGKILSIGTASQIRVPTGAVEVDAKGKVIMPGLVDTHSHIGEGSGGDRSSTLNPEVRIVDALNPYSDTFKKALAGGITTVNVMPGSGHLMSGQTAYLKLREARRMEDMLFCDDINGICGGMKMANGTNPLDAPPFSATRGKSAAMVRQLFTEAQEYGRKVKAAETDTTKQAPTRDLRMEALQEVLSGKRVVHFHTHMANDILTAIRLSKEFGFRVVLHHVSEGWKVADEIAKAGVPSSIIVIDSPGGKVEAIDYSSTNGAALEKAGAVVGFHTDDGVTDSRFFLRGAAIAVRNGMSRDKALEALTIVGAEMLDLRNRIGSLEVGKDADLVVLSGDPMSVYTHVEQTWVEGIKRFDRSNEQDHKYAVGGFEAYRGMFDYHDH
jgi:imidazolonepropionase-like amidohydrolase